MGKIPRIRKGFTLIELMLVVAIIGLLAAIALPKFANLVIKAKEASIKGKLGALRSAASIYYADNEGAYGNPSDLSGLLVPRYMDSIPAITIPTHSAHPLRNGGYIDDLFVSGPGDWNNPAGIPDLCAWYYCCLDGNLRVNCTHTDSKGTTWSQW